MPADPFPDELVEAAAKALAGEPRCYCPDDWRADPSPRCPFHGDGEWPTYAHYLQARAVLAALRAAGFPVGWQDVRERLLTREAMEAAYRGKSDCPSEGAGWHVSAMGYALRAAIDHAEEAR